MIQLFEQNHFGRIDPLTFGVWCNIDAVTAHSRASYFAPLMVAAFAAPPTQAHTDFVKELQSEEEKALAYAAFSLFAHENRHFLDLLTTPFGVYLTRTSLSTQFTYLFHTKEIHSAPALYFPFTDWQRDAKLLAEIDPDLGNPPAGISQFVNVVEKYHRDVRSIRYGASPVGTKPCAVQILEGLAILSQEACIRRYFGESAVSIFRTWTRSSPAGKWYYGAIDYVLAEAPELDTDALGLLLYLSLFGSPSSSGLKEASPSTLLPHLVDAVKGLFTPPGPTVPPQFAHFQMVLELAYEEFQKSQHKRPLRAFGDEYNAARVEVDSIQQVFLDSYAQPDLKENLESARSPIEELIGYSSELLELGAKLNTEVIFKNASNLRLSQFSDAIYEMPRLLAYFESPFGFATFGVLRDALTVLVGFDIAADALKMPGIEKFSYLRKLQANVPAGLPLSFVVIATPNYEKRPSYAQRALKLFRLLYLCRLAIDGFPSFTPISESLIGQVWDNGQRVYANGKRVGDGSHHANPTDNPLP